MSAGVVYRVAKWSECFENKKSQTYKNKAVHTMPLKFGLGFHRLMQMADAAEIYGAWVIMTMLLAKQHPRDGWVTNNGKKDGEPLSAQDLAVLTNASASSFEKMLSACSAKEIGWLELKVQSTIVARQSTMVDKQSPKVSPYSDLDLDLDLDLDSDSTHDASAAGSGERVGQASPSADEEKSEAMALAERCADCRPEYARNRDGFFAVIRGFTGPDRTISPERLDGVIEDWCIDQSNAKDPAKVPTRWLRQAISEADIDPASSPGGGSGFQKNKFGAPPDQLPRSLRSSLTPDPQTPAAPVEAGS